MRSGKKDILGRLDADIIDSIIYNQALNSFRIQINGSLSQYGMVDGISDEFEDETGIDTVNSTNESYDAVNDLYSPYNNSNIRLLLHMNGIDGSTSTTDTSYSNHTITFNGNAQLDTAQKKFGTAALLLDGTDDYLSIPDSADWDIIASNSDDWTIDLWVKLNTHSGIDRMIAQGVDVNNQWNFYHYGDIGQYGFCLHSTLSGTTIINSGYGGEISDSNWHHVALCKVGSIYGIYVDGNQVIYLNDSSTATFSAPLTIGKTTTLTNTFDGSMDEIRIISENIFNATPVVGLTDTITVPTSEYSDPIVNNMTLQSNSNPVSLAPDNVRIVLFEEDVDSVTLNTDLKAYVSRDGGTTWTQGTLVDKGDYDTSKQILATEIDISGQPSGTSMKYKLETLNNKDLKIHGIGFHWD